MRTSMYYKFATPLLFLIAAVTPSAILHAKSPLDQAYEDYIAGVHAQTVQEKNTYLNKALKIYTSFETIGSQNKEKGRLYYNIGNNYFQLGEYNWAILYYRKAQQLIPRDCGLKNNITIAEMHLNVSPSQLHPFFSTRELWILWIFLGSIAFLLYSLHIWYKSERIKYLAYFLWTSWSLLFAFLVIDTYLSPIHAVAIDSALLYRHPGADQSLVDNQPIYAGTSLTISNRAPQGDWVKVYTADQRLGYLPIQAIRLVE